MPIVKELEKLTSELNDALESKNTKKYINLKKQLGHFQEFPKSERTIKVEGESLVLDVGVEAPWLSPFGACLIRIYDIRRNAEGDVQFGVGNKTLPILGYVKAEAFYDEWPS